jgi:CRP/FNR family transcriptional regulator, cyclic AMP receptor protein
MQSPFLDILTEDTQRLVLGRCTRARFRSGSYLFHAGEAGDTLHLIAKGRVAIQVGGWGGDPVTLAILGSGDVFGELSLLGEHRRSATVKALEATETLILRAADFQKLREEEPRVNDFLIGILTAQIRRLTQQVVENAEVPATKRVYRHLVKMADLFDATEGGRDLPITQDQLASMASVGLRMTNKVVADARRAGLLTTGRGRITIEDYAGLTRRAR